MSLFSYISFPREVDRSCLINTDLTDFYYSGISISNTDIIIPDNIFKNKFVYDILVSLKLFKQNAYFKSYDNMSQEARDNWYPIEKEILNRTIYHRKQLYDIIMLNLEPNEFVEIYSIAVKQIKGKDIFDFGVPTEVRKINAEKILTSKLLDCDSNLKIIIHRTK